MKDIITAVLPKSAQKKESESLPCPQAFFIPFDEKFIIRFEKKRKMRNASGKHEFVWG